ncbi:MAG TPA: hypothetical protein VKV23_09780 [Acidimicrobiales bacterium]|nr:hypothetical protein [Acidimicrobiales bacterium]
MIVCKACGQHNEEAEEFCARCGRYLPWSGERVELVTPAEPEPVAEPEPEPPRPGLLARVLARLGRRPRPSPGAALAPARDPDTVVVPAVRPPADPHATEAETAPTEPAAPEEPDGGGVIIPLSSPSSGPAPEAAASGPTALLTGSPAIEQGAVEPARPGDHPSLGPSRARAVVLRKPTEAQRAERRRQSATVLAPIVQELPTGPQPGDVFCRRCGQFNAPTRVFCRRCGTELDLSELDVEQSYVPLSWWRRHLRRDVRVVGVGERPGRWGKASSGGGASGMLMRVMARAGAVFIGAAIVLSFLGPVAQPLRSWYLRTYRSILHRVNVTYTQQFAVGANATSSAPNHPPGLAIDDATNTYWQSKPTRRDGAGQSLTVVFSQPTTLDRIGVLSGAGPSEQAFLSEARPKRIELIFPRKPPIFETLQDTPSFQRLALHVVGISAMTVKILSVYPSATGHAVAITELEFFQRT